MIGMGHHSRKLCTSPAPPLKILSELPEARVAALKGLFISNSKLRWPIPTTTAYGRLSAPSRKLLPRTREGEGLLGVEARSPRPNLQAHRSQRMRCRFIFRLTSQAIFPVKRRPNRQ